MNREECYDIDRMRDRPTREDAVSFPGPFTHLLSQQRTDRSGHPIVLMYGRGRLDSEPPPNDRGYTKKETREKVLFELRTTFHEDGTVTTEDFPRYKPTQSKHGGVTLLRMLRCVYGNQGSEMYVGLQCACGYEFAIQAANWRVTPPKQCKHCARGSMARQRFASGYYCVDKWPVKR